MRMIAILAILAAAAVLIWIVFARSDLDRPTNPLTAAPDADRVVLMDASASIHVDPPAKGWFHHEFLLRRPMLVSQTVKEGRPAIRCETEASGSIFGRYTDIDIRKFPKLEWTWLVEKPIVSDLDERTVAGDDHPARLFIRFSDSEGGDHAMEIIWSNGVFQPGEYKYIKGFPHYVAQSGRRDVGKWIAEKVDLVDLYERISGRSDDARLTIAALFCDSDDTATSSIAYFGTIGLARAEAR